MIPRRVTLENFLSFGERQEIAFDDGEPLWVVGGPNGVGKSAVFDAITYCLFGAHRGGKNQGMDELVRHGENGFLAQFEFAFAGTGYRITRSHAKGRGRPTARVERQAADGSWQPVAGVNSAADVKGWSERTLGLPVEAFQASVLLRQGQADEILTATGTKRLEILKKIIGAERYEGLSNRVHEATRVRQSRRTDLLQQRETTPAVTTEQLADAERAAEAALGVRTRAEADKTAAAERVGLARQWAACEDTRRQLTERVAEADARAADAGRIQADHRRLDELSRVLPTLTQLVPVRDTLAATEAEATALEQEHAAASECLDRLTQQLEGWRLAVATHRDAAAGYAQQANQRRAEVAGRERFLSAAEEVAALESEVAGFDPTLDAQAHESQSCLQTAVAAEQAARDAKTEHQTLLKQAEREREQFESVEAGAKCSRCGQFVTADHAERERADILRRAGELVGKLAEAKAALAATTAAVSTARQVQSELTTTIQARDAARQRLADQRKSLEAFGGTSDAAALRREIAELTAAAEAGEQARDVERTKQQQHEAELQQAEPTLRPLEKRTRDLATQSQAARTKLASDGATCRALSAQLPADWQATPAADLQRLGRERQSLVAAGAAERFALWQQDAVRREGWLEQLAEVARQVAAIPEESRISAAEAERALAAAADAAKQADTAFGTASAQSAVLVRQAEESAALDRRIVEAEADARIHAKLDDLLGKKGLQRELVRAAEAEIVRLANDTVRNLSSGDLSIELDHADDGRDEAFALRVRREDSPPIDVSYLSGSQKFRVAVAVALAIGRFATGQARPLECVIIDEGFGSLDRDGLRATADELNSLKRHLSRIILVSHQEEFTDRFPVVIRLSKGPNGTVAEAVRR